mgnify:CR=1 FL=1
MQYSIDHSNEIIYFWGAKCGVTSAIETIMHIKTGLVTAGGDDAKTHNLFWKQHREAKKPNVDYSCYKKVFFGRNPYHRIISSFLDKVVCAHSPNMSKTPSVKNFYEFIKLIFDLKMDEQRMNAFMDSGQFIQIKARPGWDFFKRLGSPSFDLICILPPTALPEGKLIHDFNSLKKIYQITNKNELIEDAKLISLHHPFYFKNYKSTKLNFYCPFLQHIKDIPRAPRSIEYKDFYNDQIIEMFNDVYSPEFEFYSELGLDFKL